MVMKHLIEACKRGIGRARGVAKFVGSVEDGNVYMIPPGPDQYKAVSAIYQRNRELELEREKIIVETGRESAEVLKIAQNWTDRKKKLEEELQSLRKQIEVLKSDGKRV